MSIGRLAFQNFRKSFQNYLSMILSLAFTVLILFHFVNLSYAETFQALGEQNKTYIDIIIRIISLVLVCFMFFFIWYATNVFLTRRKKEIGIYVFMGLTNRRIGKLYLLETVLIGMAALVIGIGAGIVTTQLFQMILLCLSEISIELSFRFTWQPAAVTTALYALVYAVFALKGYLNIVKSSVLEMLSASGQNEYVKTGGLLLFIKAALGVCVLANGYYLAVKEQGYNVMGNLFLATALVIAGTYLLFGGFLPLLFQWLVKRKGFLYRKERTLWVNNIVFRMKKNYRTYAMTCVLLTCSVTAIAAAFAEKGQYDNIVNFRNRYTFQIISDRADMGEEISALLLQDSDIAYCGELPFFSMDGSHFSHGYGRGILAFSNVKKLAEETGLAFPYENLADDEFIDVSYIVLMSFITEDSGQMIEIDGKPFRRIDKTTVPYLGYLQEGGGYYIVNDRVYAKLSAECGGGMDIQTYTYNYKIADAGKFETGREKLSGLVYSTEESYVGLAALDPGSDDIGWIKVEYSLCVFVFLVFVLASGSILFMKLYNDAFEEKERYAILKKTGISTKSLRRAAARELLAAYAMPFFVMAVSSWFSVHSLERLMSKNLKTVNLVSVLIILLFFAVFYGASLFFYRKNALE
ncbi:MAG: ABC transporter permease [Blautia sp.]|nr:ABC transporter permease [Blautia sp.]MCM1201688.1 ABC transporter permease [Bacteroides fragilis]